jgi:YHS domain-containing protein
MEEGDMNKIYKQAMLCPVCGMQVHQPHRKNFHGAEYLFCCTDCRHQFESEPEQYI